MNPGTRVRVFRPPKNHPEWENKNGKVVSLIPTAKRPFDYRIELDDGPAVVLSLARLEVLDHQEESGAYAGFSYLIVNDLMYCQDHRLEVCGSCACDHRITNFMREINESETSGDDHDIVATDLYESVKAESIPPRQAPSRSNKKTFAAKPPFRAKVNDSILMFPASFNPTPLNIWPPRNSFYKALASNFGSMEVAGPDERKLPLHRLRETIAVLGRHWENWLSEPRDEPMLRIFLQDGGQSQGIALDLVEPVRCLPTGRYYMPFFTVRWSHTHAGDIGEPAVHHGFDGARHQDGKYTCRTR
jgi:hypothetical protein